MEQQIRFCTAADGVRIAYATVGSGPPLVKAANWLNHLEYDWQSPIWRPLFEELARDFTFVRYDERGNGLSDWKADLSLEAFVSDLEAVVDAAGLEKFALLGVSQGGAVAVQYAVRHPERVTHVILHGAYARGWGVRGNPEETERRRVMMDLIRLGWGQDNPAFRQLWTTLYIPDGTPEQMRWFNEMQRVSTSPENAIRLFDTFANIDVADVLSQVRTPTLVTHARGDAAVPYEAGRQMAARIPGARLVTLETSNHLILEGEPAWPVFIGEIRGFLGVERAPAGVPFHQDAPVWQVALDKMGDVLDRTPGAGTPPPVSSAATGSVPPLAPGDTLAHYRIVGSLGAGGMGQVYRAHDTRLERDVALKLLAGEASSDSARHRLLAEARAASALNHPHVATVYEVGEAVGRGYIAMEYVEGRALSESIPADGLPSEVVLRYGAQMAAALAHAHERGVVHRDLKSANVVITSDGNAKVLDFGLASRVQSEISEATRSIEAKESAAAVAGTLHYMAPEILRGQPADERSDLWALGVVLYEMAAGKLPFQGRTGFELTAAVLREPAAPLPAHVPPGVRGVIQRCLAKEPGQRYRSAMQVHAALEALSSDSAVATAPAATKPSVSTARPWWRRKMMWGVAALAVLVIISIWKGPTWFSNGRTEVGASLPRTSTGAPASAIPEANEYFERAQLFMHAQFDLRRARQMLERAVERDPHFAEARATYAFTHLLLVETGESNDSGWIYKAEEESRRALQDDPKSARAHANLGVVHFYQGRKESARAELLKAQELNPKEIDSYNWMIAYHQLNGENAQAQIVARDLIRRDPLFFPAYVNLADLLRERGDATGALRELDRILEQDAQNVYAIVYYARVYLDIGEVPKAREVLQRIRAEDKQGYLARSVRGLLLAHEGKRAEALKEMDEEVLKWAAVLSPLTLIAAEFYAALGDKEKALDWLERAVRNGDERADWFQRDPMLASIRNHPRFKQVLDSIVFRRGGPSATPAASPASPLGSAFVIQNPSANLEANELLQRAMMFTRYQLDPMRARPLLQRALQLDPAFSEARANYALTFLVAVETGASNDPADIYRAETELARVMREAPQLTRARSLAGAVHFYQGRGDQAVAEFQEVKRLHPNDLAARLWLVIYGRLHGETEQAMSAARELVAAEPLFWPPRYQLGELLREQGKAVEAARELDKILEQDPNNVTALRCLARTHLDSGKTSFARQTLERLRPEDRANFRVRLLQAQILAAEGKRDLALKELDEQVLRYADLQPLATLDAAEAFALAGEKDKALEWLDRSARKGDGRVEWLRRDPLLAGLRTQPRFQQIVNSIASHRK